MAKKKFVLRIDETMLGALEKWAADDFRSVNGQLEWLIAQSLRSVGRLPKNIQPEPEADLEQGVDTIETVSNEDSHRKI